MTKGDDHKKLKLQLSRAFSPSAVAGFIPTIQNCMTSFATRWEQESGSKPLLATDITKEFSLAVILETVMGFDRTFWEIDGNFERISGLYKQVQKAMFAPPINFPGSTFRRALNARKALLEEIEKSLLRVKASMSSGTAGQQPRPKKSVAEILLSSVEQAQPNEDGIGDMDPLELSQMKDVCFNMLDAGQETTSYTLTAILSALAQNKSVKEDLRKEQDELVAKYGTAMTDESVREMILAEATIKEILRNVSPDSDRQRSITVIFIRKALKTFSLGGYQIPKGYTIVGNAAELLQSDPTWEGLEGTSLDKRKFCPYRWLKGDSGSSYKPVVSPAFMPFATGPRACIGSHLAMVRRRMKEE